VRPARFEDLPVWLKAMDLALEVRRLLPLIGEDEPLGRELARSSLVVPGRIARGHGAGGRKAWQHGLAIASSAAARTEAGLTLGIQRGLYAGDDAMPSLRLVRAVAQMLEEMLEELESA
jgi:four helix bundle protein